MLAARPHHLSAIRMCLGLARLPQCLAHPPPPPIPALGHLQDLQKQTSQKDDDDDRRRRRRNKIATL
jgi:hypothetical protein